MDILFAVLFYFFMILPSLLFLAFCFLIAWFICTKAIKSIALKILIITVIVLFSFFIVSNFSTQETDDLYVEMNHFNDNQTLIGLSPEQVEAVLGKPMYEYTNKEEEKRYLYHAGKIYKTSFFGKTYSTEYYEMMILFDIHDNVYHTYIKESS